MSGIIPCCGTCRYSCGSSENLYCCRESKAVADYEGCFFYEPRKEKADEKGSKDKQ